ncbi:hypothetical protein [Methylobacterium nodulans]|uniref:hypothetical protein n=1 Tax=Methylobacterium nodulans TaxID=114616 RepID=UPI0002F6CDC4|nr:hypothetical protein [Methylobacterium nodulans]
MAEDHLQATCEFLNLRREDLWPCDASLPPARGKTKRELLAEMSLAALSQQHWIDHYAGTLREIGATGERSKRPPVVQLVSIARHGLGGGIVTGLVPLPFRQGRQG